jgi:AcrR family transcriptional regulator
MTSTTGTKGYTAAGEPGEQARPLRADAARNRDKLLETAVRVLTDEGVDVPLEKIAAQAGLGVGTLYRHFPNRNALVEAVYRHEVERLCQSPAALLSAHPPDVALQEWMGRFVEYAATKRGMSEALSAAVASGLPLFDRTRTQMLAALHRLIEACVAAGTIRPDADAEDVLRAMGGVWAMSDGPEWREQARRLLALLMDGLRYGASGR